MEHVPFQAEELVKQEVLIMLYHDAVYCPLDSALKGTGPQKLAANQASYLAYLDKNPYTEVDPDDMKQVCLLSGSHGIVLVLHLLNTRRNRSATISTSRCPSITKTFPFFVSPHSSSFFMLLF
jgi:hypothetical protein